LGWALAILIMAIHITIHTIVILTTIHIRNQDIMMMRHRHQKIIVTLPHRLKILIMKIAIAMAAVAIITMIPFILKSQRRNQQKPTPEPRTDAQGRKWIEPHWKHTDEGWIWIDGYWKKQL